MLVSFTLSPGDTFSASGGVQLLPVPEPSATALLGVGVAALGVVTLRRRRK
jgi:hypothetical protein